MSVKLNELATRVAEATKKAIASQAVETAKERKAFVASALAELMGSGDGSLKTFGDKLTQDIMGRIPNSALFVSDHGKSFNPELGLASLGKKAIGDMAKQVLFAVTPNSLRGQLFKGDDAKAMSVEIGATGGYTMPVEFVAEVARKLVHTSVFLGSCRIWSGVEYQGSMPRETGTVTVAFKGELKTPSTTDPALGSLTWALQERIALTNLPNSLWKFSGIDILELLATMFAEQFQKTEDKYYLVGSGSQQPMGLLTQQNGMTTAAISGSSLQWQDLIKLKHNIKSQYRLERQSCAYMTDNNTIELISTLTDDQNRPVYLDRGNEGIGGPNIPPQTIGFIAGYPVLENPYSPGPSSEGTSQSTAVVVFSNLKRGYYAFKGPNMEVKSSDVAYDAFLNDGIYTRATDWIDGKPAIPEATAILTGVK